jgi:hypothetical protein
MATLTCSAKWWTARWGSNQHRMPTAHQQIERELRNEREYTKQIVRTPVKKTG